jgi:GNAT superfamily N-acetyltransferase
VKDTAVQRSEYRYRVRTARPGDREAVGALLGELGYTELTPDAVKNALTWTLSHPEIEVLVAADALERPVGLIAFSHRPRLRLGGRILTIDELVVSASWRGRGLGRALLGAALARARVLGAMRVEVSSDRVQHADASSFFAREGFVEVEEAVMRHREFD